MTEEPPGARKVPYPILPNPTFKESDRVQLFYEVTNLLPPPRIEGYNQEGGNELRMLDRLLRETLGRLSLGGGHSLEERIKGFILSANEDGLYTLIELVPVAKVKSDYERDRRPGHYPEPISSHDLWKITSKLNRFLESTSSVARFDDQGRFHRDGFLAQVPVELAGLPDKERLRLDLESLLQGPRPVSVLFIDLDNFKLVNDSSGHQEGDKCLASVVLTAGSIIASRGKLYRYGGDEFSVLLQNTVASEFSSTNWVSSRRSCSPGSRKIPEPMSDRPRRQLWAAKSQKWAD